MNLKIVILGIAFLSANFAYGQTQPTDTVSKPKVLIDAEKMEEAFINNNISAYADYVFPKLFDLAGGKENFIIQLEASILDLTTNGSKLHKIVVSNPSAIVKCNGELQCVLNEELTISFHDEEPFTISAYLVGISSDNGLSWTFINVSTQDKLEKLKEAFPNICDDIPLEKNE